jgi:hypothetical protein
MLAQKTRIFIMYINQNSQPFSLFLNVWQGVEDVHSAKEFSIFGTQLFLEQKAICA